MNHPIILTNVHFEQGTEGTESRLRSRLWCIFELAAFRKASPDGKITFKPLFVEMAVLCIWVVLFGMNILFFIARLGRNGATIAAYALVLLPFPPSVYVLRKNYLAKRKLLVDMEQFDLDRVSCYSESDRLLALRHAYFNTSAFLACE